ELLVFCTYDAPLLAPLFCSSNLFFSYFARRPLSYTLFPYTTLFRSVAARTQRGHEHVVHGADRRLEIALEHAVELVTLARRDTRSEEHTSELQSRGHLVCRLLLEKKKFLRKHPSAVP